MTTQIHLVTTAEAYCHTLEWPQFFRGLSEGADLTPDGLAQAKLLGEFIAENDFPEATGIYVSPETRTRDTAITAFDQISESPKIIEIERALRDRSYGDLAKVPKKTTPLHVARDAQMTGIDIVTGGCIEQEALVADRMIGLLHRLGKEREGELGVYCFSDIEPVACLLRALKANDENINELGYAQIVSLQIADDSREEDFVRSISAC